MASEIILENNDLSRYQILGLDKENDILALNCDKGGSETLLFFRGDEIYEEIDLFGLLNLIYVENEFIVKYLGPDEEFYYKSFSFKNGQFIEAEYVLDLNGYVPDVNEEMIQAWAGFSTDIFYKNDEPLFLDYKHYQYEVDTTNKKLIYRGKPFSHYIERELLRCSQGNSIFMSAVKGKDYLYFDYNFETQDMANYNFNKYTMNDAEIVGNILYFTGLECATKNRVVGKLDLVSAANDMTKEAVIIQELDFGGEKIDLINMK